MRCNWQIRRFAVVDSTNDLARFFAISGAPEGLVVVADEQRAGRGRQGRRWLSPPGGVWCSVLLRPTRPVSERGQLALVVAVAVAEALEALGAIPELKWPNDVLCAGRKICGILVEGVDDACVVVGIGLNADVDPEHLPAEATSLRALLGRPVDRDAVLQGLLARLRARYEDWLAGRWPEIREAWRRRSAMLGSPVVVLAPSGQRVGVAVDVDENGALLLRGEGGQLERVLAGDVSVRPSFLDGSAGPSVG